MHDMQGVTGSSPVAGTKFKKKAHLVWAFLCLQSLVLSGN
ncbi:hypothetical protein VCRA2119O240_30082 [Vibrio crassostreae]|nr:hypothetical protein VCRA2116O233_20271 [Vibrio crassostreae]CAK2067469.1 hypothetical protein VCRA2113O206_30118 [Vibrio crassostreae]CAK2078658.1 hypothetical protein VCRA2113O213_30117 [Vibrio crassostreae]CAK2082860.1 hypothetical protein VCRA2113O198_30082 [Vibrio crassostreae]CAK2084305.1 hypothetical protein VCRA2110O178_30081 [Vibrio crassostreae]